MPHCYYLPVWDGEDEAAAHEYGVALVAVGQRGEVAAELEAELALLPHEHLLGVDEDLDAARVQAALHAAPLKVAEVEELPKNCTVCVIPSREILLSIFDMFRRPVG